MAGARQTIPQGRTGLTFFPTHSLAFLVLTSPPPCPPGGTEGKGPWCWGQNVRLQQVWGLCTPLSLVPTELLTLPACMGQTPPEPSGPLQPPGTLTKALWGAVCARMKRSECACVTTRVRACVGVWACQCERGRPASPHDLSRSSFGSQGEWGRSCVGSGPGNTGPEGQGDVGAPASSLTMDHSRNGVPGDSCEEPRVWDRGRHSSPKLATHLLLGNRQHPTQTSPCVNRGTPHCFQPLPCPLQPSPSTPAPVLSLSVPMGASS